MAFSKPGLPVHHQLLEFTQTHVHWVSETTQPSHPLSSPSPPAFNLSFPASGAFPMSQLFTSGGLIIGVSASASVLPMNQGWFPLGLTSLISLQSKGLSRVFSNTTVQKHQKDCCWSWNFNTLATWCEELTHWKSPWCWERFKVGGEGDNRGWDVWMASPTQCTWFWVDSGNWWQTGELVCSSPWGRKESNTTEWLNWTEMGKVR